VHRIEVESPAGKKILQWEAFGRSIGMQGEKDPVNIDVVVLLQSFNTPGTEITPGSNVIAEDFQCEWLNHGPPISLLARQIDCYVLMVGSGRLRSTECRW